MYNARDEMIKTVSKRIIATALSQNVPTVSNNQLEVNEEGIIFREKSVGNRVGPYVIRDMKDKMITLDSGDRYRAASVDTLTRYNERESTSLSDTQRNDEEATVTTQGDDANDDSTNVTHWDEMVREDLGKSLYLDWEEDAIQATGVQLPLLDTCDFVVKSIIPGDPLGEAPDFHLATEVEFEGLRRRDIWRVVPKSEVPASANILGGHFVLSIKHIGTPEEKVILQYTTQGYNDREKPYVLHDTATLHVSSMRLILSTAAVHGYRLFLHAVTQAYLQGKNNLTRKVYL